MPWQDPEAAAGVLGAQRQHPVLIDDHRERRDDAQPHGGALLLGGRGLLLARLVQGSDHVERAFRPVVGLAVEDGAAAGERVGATRRCGRACR